MAQAVALYKVKQGKGPWEQKLGLQTVCKIFEAEYYAETKRKVILDHMTLSHWVKGGKSKSHSNAEKGWLLLEEIEKVIEYAVEMANQGFPLNHQRLGFGTGILQVSKSNNAPAPANTAPVAGMGTYHTWFSCGVMQNLWYHRYPWVHTPPPCLQPCESSVHTSIDAAVHFMR